MRQGARPLVPTSTSPAQYKHSNYDINLCRWYCKDLCKCCIATFIEKDISKESPFYNTLNCSTVLGELSHSDREVFKSYCCRRMCCALYVYSCGRTYPLWWWHFRCSSGLDGMSARNFAKLYRKYDSYLSLKIQILLVYKLNDVLNEFGLDGQLRFAVGGQLCHLLHGVAVLEHVVHILYYI